MSNIEFYGVNDDFNLENIKTNINIHFNDSYKQILIFPLILSIQALYRETFERIYIDFKESLAKGNDCKPIIFLSSISWLDSIFETSKAEEIDERIQRFLKNNSFCSFLFNSSAWIQFVEIEYVCGGVDWTKTQTNYQRTIDQLERTRDLGIFENPNAKEYIEYHLRLQQVNCLMDKSIILDSGGHGRHISPTLYSNEQKNRRNIKMSDDLKFLFTDEKDEINRDYKVKGATFRILLIDDKIGSLSNCKAKLIKDLLELKFEPQHEDFNVREQVCWWTPHEKEDTVAIFQKDCCNCDFCVKYENNSKNRIKTLKNALKKEKDENKIQIVPVTNLELARQLLSESSLRFDLILMDYLLDKKINSKEDREYATDFWGDEREKFFEFSKDYEKTYEEEDVKRYKDLKSTYDQIKANRSPLQRLWIFPITAFNQTFIDDLRNKGVRLIDYYWYLSRGADPINTPYLFLNSLNKFLQLQLESAIFSTDEIKGFLKKSIERLDNIKTPDDFTAFMGSEYTVFVEKYMTRPVIYRDMQAGSLFAKFVWHHFYGNEKFLGLFKLIQYVHKFYHRCAFGTSADFNKMVLFWRELKLYITEENSLNMQDLEIDRFFSKMKDLHSLL